MKNYSESFSFENLQKSVIPNENLREMDHENALLKTLKVDSYSKLTEKKPVDFELIRTNYSNCITQS